MIEKHDEVLASLTDEYLIEWRERDDQNRTYANRLLQVPSEYRQGIEARVVALTVRSEYYQGMIKLVPTYIRPDEAYSQALRELVEQGVALLSVPD